MDKSLFYSPNKLLSYNRILNFVVGARGIGKTYAMKVHVVKRFLKYGKQFVYIRRYKDELSKLKNFFADIQQEFPNTRCRVKGKEIWIDPKNDDNWKLAGWGIALTSWQKEKSNAYPMVETILFDEFMRQKDVTGYIKNEVEAFLSLMDTIFRSREDVRAVCLSNSTSITNPYFMYFNLVPDLKKRFNSNENIVVEIPDSSDFSEERKKTKFGNLITGTTYGDLSLENEFVNDSSVFIEPRTAESRHVFNMVYDGITMGVWVDENKGLLYVSPQYDPINKKTYAMTTDDQNENNLLMLEWRKAYGLNKMVRAFKASALRFENQTMRNVSYELFKKMRIY